MSQNITDLPVKTLIKVLAHTRGGEIGFDPFRDPRTSKKENLLTFILQNHSNEEIIRSLAAVDAMQADIPPTTKPTMPTGTAIDYVGKIESSHAPKTDDAAQLAALLARMAGDSKLDTAKVDQMIGAALFEYESTLRDLCAQEIAKVDRATRVEIKTPVMTEFKDMGVTHKCFPDLLIACAARTKDGHRLNIWLAGPAGSGKTSAAHKIADALELKFYSNGSLLTEHSLMGYKDAGGSYHRTAFRDAYEYGGVYLGDEFDGWNPNAVVALNAATANGFCAFPDGMIKRHADCIIIAGANTFGHGATSDYAGRLKQDKASLDRFVTIEWPIDEKLERAFSGNTEWTALVQKYRLKITERSVKGHLITPRASVYGEALLAAGMPEERVIELCIRKGLDQTTWDNLS